MESRGKGQGSKFNAEDETDDTKLGADSSLDALWAKFREFLNDIKENGEKRDIRGVDKANKLRFTEAT